MLTHAEELITNYDLLNGYPSNGKPSISSGFIDAIAAQRAFRDNEEASSAAHELNNVLACVEYGLELSESQPNNLEAVLNGLRTIVESCRLVNLRVEQFLDIQDEVKENRQKELHGFFQEYNKIKIDHKDYLLLFQIGDFYEAFWDDAKTISNILNTNLCFRNLQNDHEKVPISGLQVHEINLNIAKLVKAGQKIAICDQVKTDGDFLGYEVVRVITPGKPESENIL